MTHMSLPAKRPNRALGEHHRLQLLQMALEKLAKAFLYHAEPDARYSHHVVQSALNRLRSHAVAEAAGMKLRRSVGCSMRQGRFSSQIEAASPSVGYDGRGLTREESERTANVEYPWQADEKDDASWVAPASHQKALARIPSEAANILRRRGYELASCRGPRSSICAPPPRRRIGLAAGLLALTAAGVGGVRAGSSPSGPADPGFESAVLPYLNEHCTRCHGEKKHKGELRLDTLSRDFAAAGGAARWGDVIDRISSGEMPPEEEPQPKAGRVGPRRGVAGRQAQGGGGGAAGAGASASRSTS